MAMYDGDCDKDHQDGADNDKWQNRVDALPRHRKYFIQNRVDPLSSLLNTHLQCQSCAHCIITRVLQSSWLYLCGMMLIHLRTEREIYFLCAAKISHQGSQLVPEFISSQKSLSAHLAKYCVFFSQVEPGNCLQEVLRLSILVASPLIKRLTFLLF